MLIRTRRQRYCPASRLNDANPRDGRAAGEDKSVERLSQFTNLAAVAGIFVLSVAADAAGYAYVLNFDGTEVVKIPAGAGKPTTVWTNT